MEKQINELAMQGVQLHDLKLAYIYSVLKRCNGNLAQAHRVLGISRFHMTRLVRRYEWTEFGGSRGRNELLPD